MIGLKRIEDRNLPTRRVNEGRRRMSEGRALSHATGWDVAFHLACLPISISLLFFSSVANADDELLNQSALKQSALKQSVPTKTSLVTLTKMDLDRWMVVLCSLGGDEEHEKRLTEAVKQVHSSAGPVFGVQPEHIRVLLSSKEMAKTIPDSKPCNRKSMAELSADLAAASDNQSQYLFFVLGHSHLEGRSCQFNIDGPDIDQLDFAKLFGSLPGKEQIHWIGLPASGYWIKPLSGPNRIIISATEPALEITATEMPYALGAILAGTAEHSGLSDIDGDGSLTLMDLYLSVNIEIHQSFVTQDYVPTEHAQLDDNGDGRGSELQEPFLPRKEGDRPARKFTRKFLDGDQARKFLLRAILARD